jgi:hypothetical protein
MAAGICGAGLLAIFWTPGARIGRGTGAWLGQSLIGNKWGAGLWFDFQGSAEFVDFFFDEQAVASLREAFECEWA